MSKNWPTVPLGEILVERREIPDAGAIASGEIPIVSKISFNDGKIVLRTDGETKTGMILARNGDLVVSGINAAKGAIAVYKGDSPIAATIHYGAYIPNKNRIDVSYLWWLLRSQAFKDLLEKYVPGGIKTELKSKRLLPIPVPLPSVSEQCRIVAQIKSIAEKISEANVLQNQSASKIEYIVKSLLNKSFDKYSQKFGLKFIGELLLDANYGTSQYCDYDNAPETTPVLRIPNVAFERIDLADLKYAVLPQSELGRVLVKENDVLVVRTNGSLDLVGRSAVVPSLDRETAFASYLIRLKCDWGLIMPEYLQMMMKHLRFKGQLIDLARTTAGQYNVSLGRLRTAKIPVPPMNEQKRFMQEMNNFQNQIDGLKKHKAEIQKEINAILPSIIDKAFKGELG